MYIDPGTGGLFIQIIVAASATALISIKMNWRRITSLWNRIRGQEQAPMGMTEDQLLENQEHSSEREEEQIQK